MTVQLQTRKLAELRAKTDQQLQEVVEIHLNRGLDYAGLMVDAESRGHSQLAESFRNLALQECDETERLQAILAAAGKSHPAAARLRELREYLGTDTVRIACA
jgi:hypothetical protein